MTAPECAGCPFPDSVAALELVRLREGIGRLATHWEECAAEATKRGQAAPWDGLTFAQEKHAEILRALLDDNQGDSC